MAWRDIVLSKAPSRFDSIASYLESSELPRGVVEVQHGGMPIHFFSDRRDSETTFVTFSGAVSQKVHHVPAWAGFGTSSHLGVNRMLISDPTIILHNELRLAWYGGSIQQPDLQDALTTLIRKFAGDTRLVFFGPSGGGFAAMLQAARFPGSTALVSNPQTDVKLFNRVAVERYLKLAWGIDGINSHPLPFIDEIVSTYSMQVDASLVYVQNEGDLDHVERHLEPFLYGLHPANRVVSLRPQLGHGHIGPDKDSFMRLFTAVCEQSDWAQLEASVRGLSLTRNL